MVVSSRNTHTEDRMQKTTETQKIKLSKKWGPHKKGAVIVVDDLRAKWLLDHDFLEKEKSSVLASEPA